MPQARDLLCEGPTQIENESFHIDKDLFEVEVVSGRPGPAPITYVGVDFIDETGIQFTT